MTFWKPLQLTYAGMIRTRHHTELYAHKRSLLFPWHPQRLLRPSSGLTATSIRALSYFYEKETRSKNPHFSLTVHWENEMRFEKIKILRLEKVIRNERISRLFSFMKERGPSKEIDCFAKVLSEKIELFWRVCIAPCHVVLIERTFTSEMFVSYFGLNIHFVKQRSAHIDSHSNSTDVMWSFFIRYMKSTMSFLLFRPSHINLTKDYPGRRSLKRIQISHSNLPCR